jgi:GNAT superfamily N-acetyltransferase
LASIGELTLRPVRPADRDRITEMTKDVWEGHDYISRVFDRWVSDAGAAFEAAEVDGVVAGVQRLRPFAPGMMWYEGLRVAPEQRRRGVARAMLQSAIEESREQGFREIRLATRDQPAIDLFESVGFKLLVAVRWWRGPRVEGGEPARMPDASDANRLWAFVASSPGIEQYGGVIPDLNGSPNLDVEELQRRARHGLLRLGPSGRALAVLREPWGQNIAVALLAGTGGAMRELLLALRFEADADGLSHVSVNVPAGHPVEDDLKASGYDFADADLSGNVYSLILD